ncbi:MAG: DUF4426 domain-containing protein [Ectothiorhodospiraceae bacterium]|nr:DUF4426 domain-containing protein [Ectothiorhodospiraceae bacterium]
MRLRHILGSAAALLALAPLAAQATGTASYGEYSIHYATRPTAELQPELAQNYGITRSRTLAMIIVSVRRDGEPVAARVHGAAFTDAGEQRDIRFRRVEVAGTVNQMGTFSVDHLESLHFQLEVIPETGQRGYPVRFRETFFMR